MAIDLHYHWMPPELAAAIRNRTASPTVARDEDGVLWLNNGGSRLIRVPEGFGDDVHAVVAMMDEVGLGRAVLSLSTIFRIECLSPSESLELCRLHNDSVSRATVLYPERLHALAVIPSSNLAGGLAEFKRAIRLPGIIGALLLGDGFLSKKRAERFGEIFEAANECGAMIFIHYGYLPDDPNAPKPDTSDNAFLRIAGLDFQQRVSSNLVTLVLTDFLDRYPDVCVVSHNLGGNIPFEIERMYHRSLLDQPPGTALPSERFRNAKLLIDCNSFGPRALERAIEVFGADKIVLGSDGSRFGAVWALKAINDARISDNAKNAILKTNAAHAIDGVIRRLGRK